MSETVRFRQQSISRDAKTDIRAIYGYFLDKGGKISAHPDVIALAKYLVLYDRAITLARTMYPKITYVFQRNGKMFRR